MTRAQPAKASPSAPPRIRIEPIKGTARAFLDRQVLAESNSALLLREGTYPPRVYFPMDDVRMNLLIATEKSTHCPYKGDASYWTAAVNGTDHPNVAWAYRTPIDDVAAIKDHISFADPVVTES